MAALTPRLDELLPHLRSHGRCAFSYATLQDGLEHFVTKDGYIAFTSVRDLLLAPFGRRVCLADPVAPKERYAEIIRDFTAKRRDAAFVSVSKDCATALHGLGFKVNCMGYEASIPLQSYNTKGDWHDLHLIRRARNETRKQAIVIDEADIGSVDAATLDQVSARWLEHKPLADREIWLYARPPVFGPEPDVRKFVAKKDGAPVGFAFYDPIYDNGTITGYAANISRSDESRFRHLSVAMHMVAAERFRAEGKRTLNLCVSPFYNTDKDDQNDSALVAGFFRFAYEHGNQMYNFKGLSSNKERYKAPFTPVYFASNRLMPLADVYCAFAASDMVRSPFEVARKLAAGWWKNRKPSEAVNAATL